MGIPTCVELMQDFDQFLGDHPFINVNKNNIFAKIEELINFDNHAQIADKGRKWLQQTHSPKTTVGEMIDNYCRLGWIAEEE
jgi:hypothetical protein